MQVTVHFNGVLLQLAGKSRVIEVEDACTVQAALANLAQSVPALSPHLPRTACAIGVDLVPRQRRLATGEELVLIPPVSGG